MRADHQRATNLVEPIGFDGAGRIVSIGVVRGDGGATRPARFHIDRDGVIVQVDTVATPPADSLGDRTVIRKRNSAGVLGQETFYFFQLFGPTFLVAYSTRGEWARSVTSRYDIEWFDRDGRHLRTIRHPVEGPPLSGAERKRAQERIDDFLTRTTTSPPRASRACPVERRRYAPWRLMWMATCGSSGL